MADATSGPERPARVERATQRFGTIVVVGGGCYGGYYVRQLARAERAGALAWAALLVVDRDPDCAVSRLPEAERPGALQHVTTDWAAFLADYLGTATTDPLRHEGDA